MFRKVNTDDDKQHLQHKLDKLVKLSDIFFIINTYIQDTGTWI